MLRNTCRQ